MTVYVDAAIHEWRGKKWCHLFAADESALHAFARRLGLQAGWFQHPPHASWPHYDITAARRARALRLGAVSADRWQTVLIGNDALLAWCTTHRPDLIEAATARRTRWLARAASCDHTRTPPR